MGNAITCPFYRCSVHGPERLDGLPETWSPEPRCEPLESDSGEWAWAGPTSWRGVGLRGRWGEGASCARGGAGDASLLPGGPRLAPSPRGPRPYKGSRNLSLARCQTQVAAPELQSNKVRLVYLSSSGLLSQCRWLLPWEAQQLPASPPRRAELHRIWARTCEGAEVAAGPGPAPPPPAPSPRSGSRGPSPSAVLAQGRAPGAEPPHYPAWQVLSPVRMGRERRRGGALLGAAGGCWQRVRSPSPSPGGSEPWGPMRAPLAVQAGT